jgi:heterodisulfide reductase subunit B2
MSRKYSYFPGCCMHAMSPSYQASLLPVLQQLGIEMEELDDWNCCGATAYMAVDEIKACTMASRNLAIAQRSGDRPVIAPCSGCYLVLNKTNHYLNEVPSVGAVVRKALQSVNLSYDGQIQIRHPLDVLVNEVGIEAVKKQVKHPLKGLKVVPYYGCQIVRPYATFDDPYNPVTMDHLLAALGATVVPYPLKTRCCGGSLTGTLPEPGLLCAYILLKEAKKRGADVIATICPLCQVNLDSYRDRIAAKWEPMDTPVVFFSQLMALAFGFPESQTAFNRLLTPFRMPETLVATA